MIIRNYTEKIWKSVQKAHPEANFLQSPEWAKINEKLGHKVIIEDLKDGDVALMIVKNAKRGRYLEIPGGPLLDWENHEKTEQTFVKIKQIAKENRCAFVRLRPQLEKTAENLEIMKNLGLKPAPFHLHAEHTVMIDLDKSEDELLANMRRQTRYEVRRAKKLGLKVEKSSDAAAFKEFHKIQAETAARQHFIPPTEKDLSAYRDIFGKNAVIYRAVTGKPGASPSSHLATTGEQENLPVALGLIITSASEAAYFEAASTDLNRKLPGAYALLWQAMKDLKKQGIKRFNLWGIAPPPDPKHPNRVKNHRYFGVTTFKTGFGGRVTEFVPAQDLVLNPPRYAVTKLIETVRKKKRHL